MQCSVYAQHPRYIKKKPSQTKIKNQNLFRDFLKTVHSHPSFAHPTTSSKPSNNTSLTSAEQTILFHGSHMTKIDYINKRTLSSS